MNEQGTIVPTRRVYWLLECFDKHGMSRGLYWSGLTNRIVYHPLGLEATFNVERARRIPQDMGDVARALAVAANKAYPSPSGSVWVATEHMWCDE